MAVGALRHRNFRLLWIGQLVSMSGTTMQNAALLWHVSLLVQPEQKALALGFVGLARVIPIIALSLVGGVLADVVDRRRLLAATQGSMAVMAAVLALLTFSGHVPVWAIYMLAALTAAAASFDGPARQSLIPSLVPVEDLPNAISLNTVVYQVSSVAGPSLAGVVIATGGVAWVYAANAVSFLFVIAALVLMRDLPPVVQATRATLSTHAIIEGLRFVFSSTLIRSTMLLDFFATFFSSAIALLPIFAQDVLGVGPNGYGWLYAAPAIGAVISGVIMVRGVEWIENRGRALVSAVLVYGVATIVFGLSRNFWLTFLCLAATGAADNVSTVLRNLVRQLLTPDHLRGRMISVNMIFFLGGPQLGELEAGLVANWLGAPFSVVSGGIACVVATAWIGLKVPALLAYRKGA